MKKRKIQRFIKRVSCRVGALLSTCLVLVTMVVPAFASNNATSRKWVVVSETSLDAESGSKAKYFELVPYENGQRYAAVITTSYGSVVFSDGSESNIQLVLMDAVNSPDWWRSSLPLGSWAYVSFGKPNFIEASYNGSSESPTSFQIFLLNSTYALKATGTYSNSTYSPNGYSQFQVTSNYPFYCAGGVSPVYTSSGHSTNYFQPASVYLPLNSTSMVKIQNYTQFAYSSLMFGSSLRGWGSLGIYETQPFSNLSSDELVFAVIPSSHTYYSANSYGYCSISVPISFFIAADKLPAGLKIGDEFPADTDAFDQLRDDLIKQFPEASENIENGKSTLNGWNDTETVGQDVAESSLSVINGLFQNLGQFLAVVSLMIFGAVCLRMLIKKAVSG